MSFTGAIATVAVLNTGNCPGVTPLGYVTEMAPAFVVRLLPHPDRSAMDEKEIERSTRSHDTENRHRPSMRVNRANEECCELSDMVS
jgi:hypothetical protein